MILPVELQSDIITEIQFKAAYLCLLVCINVVLVFSLLRACCDFYTKLKK